MAPPKSRVRKFHRRSKNGCTTCKQRHVRCDERKPLWYASLCHPFLSLDWAFPSPFISSGEHFFRTGSTYIPCPVQSWPNTCRSTNCLQTGKDCIYPESEPDHDSRAASESVASEASAPLVNVVSHQPFAGFSGDYQMSPMSQWLWHQCKWPGPLSAAVTDPRLSFHLLREGSNPG